jgi:DNA (cytosine-5)-methyltransferase 1
MLFRKYVQVVEAVQPDLLLVENVGGMQVAHGTKTAALRTQFGRPTEAFSQRLVRALSALDYDVHSLMLDARDFGVPQRRSRLFILGIRHSLESSSIGGVRRLIALIEENRLLQLEEFGISARVSAANAIGDLETKGRKLKDCTDPESPRGFRELEYSGPRTPYQCLMHGDWPNSAMNSMRLARHSSEVATRFERILRECRRDVSLQKADRNRLGIRKQRTVPLSQLHPSPCITTLPDDIVHYSEPRILTVRECARFQSFPDWFRFYGRFTTGGSRRARECPRYTQVGNAVAPLVARAVGLAYSRFLSEVEQESHIYSRKSVA